CGRMLVYKSGKFGRFLACPGWPECGHTQPIVEQMPGKCPKCGGRLLKRTGTSKRNGRQYVYYACEFVTRREDAPRQCDFMTFDVPVEQNCPTCGQTMFKLSGKGARKPFCINPECPNFLPEDKRGYYKKKDEEGGAKKKSAAKKTTAKKTATKKTATKKK
ncbi:MAG: topoisomerase DNA-binding C4 zinc finger domain-containing protein, partial [Oscillospiraceae bacterium]|nr:topoisomerase DNA-binding C4 zinc finger domain-containing protein [Oscillospiraceae bacterium]